MYDIGCNHPGECSPEWSCCVCVFFFFNKNALSSVESRLLGDNFGCQRRLLFRLEYKTSVICHNVNTQNEKNCKEKQAAYLSFKPM